MSDLLANFTCMDELIQVIYQSIYKFVVLSTVSDCEWSVYVGLNSAEGRWWHGSWTEADIYRIFGPSPSDNILEAAAEKMANAFVQGELCITDWSPDKGAQIKLTLGPAAKKALHVDLVEMSPEDAAARATRFFIDIGLQAQMRQCHLYPSTAYSSPQDKSQLAHEISHTRLPLKRKEPAQGSDPVSTLKTEVHAAQEEITSLKSQLEDVKRKGTPNKDAAHSAVAPAARHKGASLANPNKKARKYQAIEFESDDE
ncbi:hypothetical protein CVT26_015065 [Gymnopilus dilepis]|uniref:Uncharacterized protein n=1 Tax=Gymnopilus dilepis TaxID=231916 RepID=A0A409WQW1_9AGAR|nr:hypothetical protein CVT26_015065 [Gymnopilus dilepis]